MSPRSYSSPLRERHTAATRAVILEALGAELAAGSVEDFSVARLAQRAGVSERTVYRHFATREALLDGLSEWYNERVADFPDDVAADAIAPTIAQVFADFDTHESLARAVLASPGGREMRQRARAARLARLDAALAPLLQRADPERGAAARALIFALCSAQTWQSMRDEGGLDGATAGRAVANAIELILNDTTSPASPCPHSSPFLHPQGAMSTTTPSSAHARIPARGGESMHVLGDLIHVKVTAEQTGGAFSMFEIIAPPGGGPPLHRHTPCEAFHVLEGTLVIRGADGAQTPAAPGETVFVAANAAHSYHNPGPGNARFLVTLAPGGFEAFFADLGTPASDATEPEPLTREPDIAHVVNVTARHGIDILEGPPPAP